MKYSVPIVSTIGNFLTIAFLLAILITPMANVTVTTIGNPSGMAATAKLKTMYPKCQLQESPRLSFNGQIQTIKYICMLKYLPCEAKSNKIIWLCVNLCAKFGNI